MANIFQDEQIHELRRIGRVALQDLLDRRAAAELSFSVVTHLRFDLRQIFRLAVAEGFIERNPAELLFTPRTAKRTERRVATVEQVAQVFSVLDLRERAHFQVSGNCRNPTRRDLRVEGGEP